MIYDIKSIVLVEFSTRMTTFIISEDQIYNGGIGKQNFMLNGYEILQIKKHIFRRVLCFF